MANIRQAPDDNPVDQRALSKALDVVLKAQAMGLIEEQIDVFAFDFAIIKNLLKQIGKWGLGRALVRDVDSWQSLEPREIFSRLNELDQILEESAKPETEWRAVRQYLSDQFLTQALSVSEQSIRRYVTAERPTPPEVAEQVHFLALVIGDLSGSYDRLGVSQWFTRPRKKAFGGKTPCDFLSGNWRPEDAGPTKVREFAKSLNFCLGT